jgi:serine/threonine protein kinase
MTDFTGQTIGRYHIIEALGEGGMATVYKAFDTRLERNVAIKVIRTDLFGTTVLNRMLKRFEREAKVLAKLSHPNIVKVLDYGEHDGAPYLVMEYLPGGTLKQKLAGRQISWQDAIRLLMPVARALAHAHASGIIHRDIKPSNILITQTGEPMLSDFGIAKILENETTTELTTSGAGIGTPDYMAPEQGMGQADERADVYALGIILYQMVTGHVPFRADTPMAVMLKKNQEPLPRPKQFVPSLPDSVEHVLIKLLARDPAFRFQTADEVTLAFDRLLRNESTATEVIPKPPRRKFTWIVAVAFLLLTCLVGGGVLGWNLLMGGGLLPQASTTPLSLGSIAGSITNTPIAPSTMIPIEITSTQHPPSLTPSRTPVPPTSSLSNPAQFARWYFTTIWKDRDYEFIWNNCQTPAFHDSASSGKYSDFTNWWDSVRQVDLVSVDVLQNNGQYATINVVLTFYLVDGRTLSNRSYDYDLTYNTQTQLWMFDHR